MAETRPTSVMSLRIDDDVAARLDRIVNADPILAERGVNTRAKLINDLLREYVSTHEPHSLRVVVDGAVVEAREFTYSPETQTLRSAIDNALESVVKERRACHGRSKKTLHSRVMFEDFLEVHEDARRRERRATSDGARE